MRRWVAWAAVFLLLAPALTSPAQTGRRAGERFKVAYSRKGAGEGGPPYDGYLSVLPGGLEFRGRQYQQDRVRAAIKGAAFAERFSCAEMRALQFHPEYSAIDVEVRGRPRFIYCPRGFAQLREAITRRCGQPGT